MSRSNIPNFPFTTGPKPDWESDIDYGDLLRSVPKSCVILQSLKQSRERWLSDTFPRFSFKTRGKNTDPQPPPHMLSSRGKCDLKIGPHIFSDTTFYEAHYKTPQNSAPATPAPQAPASSWPARGSTSYGATSYVTSASMGAPLQSAPTSVSTGTTSTLSAGDISQTLITKVNEAAASNPTLASLLHQAAAGTATPEQLQTLGVLIQQLASPTEPTTTELSTSTASPSIGPALQHQPSTSMPAVPPPPVPETDFDLIIVFKERPQEKWLFPRVPVVLRKDEDASEDEYDIAIEAQLPFDTSIVPWLPAKKEPEKAEEMDADAPREVVSFNLKRPAADLWDTLNRWSGDAEQQEENVRLMEEVPQPERVFLAHTLPQCDLLVALQNASHPPYQMKTLKPGVNTKARPRRRPPPKNKDDAQAPQKDAEAAQEKTPSAKRRRTTQPEKKTPPIPIHCTHCKKTDVPLIQGGRYCRPCVEAGHATPQPSSLVSTPAPQAPPPPPPESATAPNISDVPTNIS